MAVPGELPGLMTPPRLDGHGVSADVDAVSDFQSAAHNLVVSSAAVCVARGKGECSFIDSRFSFVGVSPGEHQCTSTILVNP